MMTEAEFEFAAKNHHSSMTFTGTEEWAYNTWSGTLTGGTDPVGINSGSHDQKTRRNSQGVGDPITGRLIRSIEGVGPGFRLTLSADTDLPPGYIHPCRLPAPNITEPVNSYRDPRWVTGSNARWSGINLMVWEDGTARLGTTNATNGQWFTSNNINLVFIPNNVSANSPVRRYAYIFLDEGVGTYLSPPAGNMGGMNMVMSGRIEKEAVGSIDKPAISNLRRGEDLARTMDDFNTYHKMVDMANMSTWAAGQQDERLLDGPNHGWLQINVGSAHHYRKDIDSDEFRFMVSGTMLANGSWFTVNNTFLRVTHPGTGNNPQPYVVDYLYVITPDGNRFNHNSFMGYERGDMRVFTRMPNDTSFISTNWPITPPTSWNDGLGYGREEIPKSRAASMYASNARGASTFIPAPCPEGGCR